jgi:hypothetical protein
LGRSRVGKAFGRSVTTFSSTPEYSDRNDEDEHRNVIETGTLLLGYGTINLIEATIYQNNHQKLSDAIQVSIE